MIRYEALELGFDVQETRVRNLKIKYRALPTKRLAIKKKKESIGECCVFCDDAAKLDDEQNARLLRSPLVGGMSMTLGINPDEYYSTMINATKKTVSSLGLDKCLAVSCALISNFAYPPLRKDWG